MHITFVAGGIPGNQIPFQTFLESFHPSVLRIIKYDTHTNLSAIRRILLFRNEIDCTGMGGKTSTEFILLSEKCCFLLKANKLYLQLYSF